MIIHVTNIEWDTDGQDVDLPNEFDIDVDPDGLDPDDPGDEDAFGDLVGDAVSDTYGFCHKGFLYEVKK
jgi:hypothetical protein